MLLGTAKNGILQYMAEEQSQQNEWSEEINKGRILMQWTFPEYQKPERGPLWFLLMFGLGAFFMWYAVADGNFLFALIILLFALIIFTHHRTEPLEVSFTAYDAGLQIGDRFLRYRELQAFSVVYEPPQVKQLYLIPKKAWLRTEISIPLGDQNPVRIREMLIDFIEEDLEREEESVDDLLNRVFKL